MTKMVELGWTNDQIVNLIQEYKNRPMLWDPNNDFFRVQTSKYEAWCELAEIFDCEIADLKKKFNSIFASHRREKSKVKLGGRSTWFLYNHLSFLPSHVAHDVGASIVPLPSTPRVNMLKWISRKRPKLVEYVEPDLEVEQEVELEHSDEASDQELDNDTAVDIIIKEEPQLIEEASKFEYVAPKLNMRGAKKRHIDRNIAFEKKLIKRQELYRRKEMYKKKDECDSFGEYIATSLRKHDERSRSMIKQAINNILFEQEMKKYNNAGQYVVLSSCDVNPLIIGDECVK